MGSIGKRLQQNNVQRSATNTPQSKSITTTSTNVPKPKGSVGAGATPQTQSNSVSKSSRGNWYGTNISSDQKLTQDQMNQIAQNMYTQGGGKGTLTPGKPSTPSKPSGSTGSSSKPSGSTSSNSSRPNNNSSSSSSSSNSPYNNNTNYNNEKKYLDNLIATGTDGQKNWAKEQMGVLNNWYVSSGKNQSNWDNYDRVDKPTFGKPDPGSIQMNNNKPYETSQSNKDMYGNDTSTHLWKAGASLDTNRGDVDKNGLYVSNIYGSDENGFYKQNASGQRWYMNDNNKQDFASHIQLSDGSWISTGGTGNFGYHENAKETFRFDEHSYGKVNDRYNNVFGTEGSRDEDRVAQMKEWDKQLAGMSAEELAEIKNNTDSQMLKNYISAFDGTALNDENYKGIAPVAFAPDGQQFNLQNMVYDFMQKNGGIESYNGKDTLSADQMLNQMGLSGMFDINQVTEPLMMEIMAQMEAEQKTANDPEYEYESEFKIDSKAIMDEFVANGGLKEGYLYDQETGSITVDPRYVQMGGILADKTAFINNYHSEAGWMDGQLRHENNTGQMTETPLEIRERTAPQSMTPQMKEDLQMEREIKAQLEQLTLDLSFLEELEGMGEGMPMVLGSGVGSGGGAGSGGIGNTNPNANLSGAFGNGGANDFQWAKGGGRGAVYGTSQNGTNADMQLLNAMARRGGVR